MHLENWLRKTNTLRILIREEYVLQIFSGPIEIHNEVPRNLPYYKLIQNQSLGNFLYDYASENSYTENIANVLKNIFPAEKWIKKIEVSKTETIMKNK